MVKRIYQLVVISCGAFSLLTQYSSGVRANETTSEFDYKNFEFWVEQCKSFFDLQKYTETVAACEKAISLKPKKNNVLMWTIRSNALLKLGNYAEAVISYNQVLQIEPNNSFALTQKCQALSQMGNYEDGILSCEKALRVNGNWGNITPATAWYNRGLALRNSNKNQEAIISFERAILIKPDYSLVFAEKCGTLRDLNDSKLYKNAIEACNNAIKINGDWGESNPAIAYKYKAEVLTKLGKLSSAIDVYQKALEINADDAMSWYEQGKLQQKLSMYDKALASYSMAVQVKPKFSQALARQAEILNELKNYQAALESSDQALAGDGIWEDTTLAYVWVQRSTALVNLGKYEESIADAERAIALRQSYAEAWNNKAVSLWNLGKYKEAEKAAIKATGFNYKYAQGWFNRGRILSSLKKYSAAVTAYEKALKGDIAENDNVTPAMILSNQGVANWHLGKYFTALDSIKKATKLNPELFEVWYNRGVVFLELKKYNSALEAYQKANSINPDNPFVWTGIAMAIAGKGDYTSALKAVDKALNINPNYTLAQQQREIIIAKLKPKLEEDNIKDKIQDNNIKENN